MARVADGSRARETMASERSGHRGRHKGDSSRHLGRRREEQTVNGREGGEERGKSVGKQVTAGKTALYAQNEEGDQGFSRERGGRRTGSGNDREEWGEGEERAEGVGAGIWRAGRGGDHAPHTRR